MHIKNTYERNVFMMTPKKRYIELDGAIRATHKENMPCRNYFANMPF